MGLLDINQTKTDLKQDLKRRAIIKKAEKAYGHWLRPNSSETWTSYDQEEYENQLYNWYMYDMRTKKEEMKAQRQEWKNRNKYYNHR